jgi:3-deoxy-manno-octulosonate cytidylyltransferase (CMP-KDO synthetase)
MNKFNVVIPARLESTRLPRKVLLQLCGQPMIRHVWDRAMESGAAGVVIATDSAEVAEVATAFGAEVSMTASDCASGTDRVAEVSRQLDWGEEEVVINVQGDAPLVAAASIQHVAQLLFDSPTAAMATLCVPLADAQEYTDPNVVKVTFSQAGKALYFSRAPIPAAGHTATAGNTVTGWRHLGIYGYRVAALRCISAAPPCELELTERLEQLRALWLGYDIRIAVDENATAPDVDTAADLELVEALMQQSQTR